ncbi:TlyA family RNA methyltransferase [Bradyrhizobium sp. WD16]|uniref:TlyA family RNA methyltransferase n=1 Tax=Bradyrhizobium sp. WD16 TaxID=1521768 RepID=UPI0020A56842|nr:TlyA family RNA methyltransferase [Bradyrhizobium sp. WD16]UTD25608.1 TlyA family rRNA (cytidine-2'-O)-methyltransferase [Bradyrhizobium sp. WD16]
MTERQRADLLLVARGLFDSRAQARAAIEAGMVSANGRKIGKPSELLAPDAAVIAAAAHPWASRGGVKLDGALARYPLPVAGHACLDVGASTGGFTDVLLAHGARHVDAVDVGHSQMHERLRSDPRVRVLEHTDIRKLAPDNLSERPDIVVIDVSFISLKHVLPAALGCAARPTFLLALIKPQFEAERRHLKKGIVRDAAVHDQVCRDIVALAQALGCGEIEVFSSSITGGDGNREFFLGARRD